MAEYIDREKLYKDLLFGGDDDYIEAYSIGMIEGASTADVIERSKIDKAIEEIKNAPTFDYKLHLTKTEVIRKEVVLEILKRNIGE